MENLQLETVVSENIKELKIQTLLLINSELKMQNERLSEHDVNREEYIKGLEGYIKQLEVENERFEGRTIN